MKAIILAAGLGSRLGSKTQRLPKGMLQFHGKPLIKWQIDALRSAGIKDIVVVTGHCSECIDFPDVEYVHNPNYASTNMLESLLCTREHLTGGFILSYADIVYEPGLVSALISSPAHIAVAADIEWRRYWTKRFGSPDLDLESFSVGSGGQVLELGKSADSPADITHRYVGLLKFSAEGAELLLDTYDKKKLQGTRWQQSGNEFNQGYLTDILDDLIRTGKDIAAVETVNGWLEFDEPEDFRVSESLVEDGLLGRLGNFVPEELLSQKKKLCYEFAPYSADSIREFIVERQKCALRFGGEYLFPLRDVTALQSIQLVERRAQMFGWDGYMTEHVLETAVMELIRDSRSTESIRVVDCLHKQFEVRKALFSCYKGDSLKFGCGPFMLVANYIYLAFGLALRFKSTGNLNYLNTLIKINDLLVADGFELNNGDKERILLCLSMEANFVSAYYEVN